MTSQRHASKSATPNLDRAQITNGASPPWNNNGKRARRMDEVSSTHSGRVSKHQRVEVKSVESDEGLDLDVDQFEDELLQALEEFGDDIDSRVPLGENPPISHAEPSSSVVAAKNKPHKLVATPRQSPQAPPLVVDPRHAPVSKQITNLTTAQKNAVKHLALPGGPHCVDLSFLKGPSNSPVPPPARQATEVVATTTASQSPYHPPSHSRAPSVVGEAAPQPRGSQQSPAPSSFAPTLQAPLTTTIAALVQRQPPTAQPLEAQHIPYSMPIARNRSVPTASTFPAIVQRHGPGMYPTQVLPAPTHQNGFVLPPPPYVSRTDLLQFLSSATVTATGTSTSNGIGGSGGSATTMSAHATFSNRAPMNNYVPPPPAIVAGPSSFTGTVFNADNNGASADADASDSKLTCHYCGKRLKRLRKDHFRGVGCRKARAISGVGCPELDEED
ncbi:hypothetical protein AAF712_013293 [Marasmius tenuissimus]|uniref:Uncharacterized protein n=1 Tax=Marasmius tenuissimus TaxID=585030 RepID=A0ABR2ZFF5_9AGAR